MTDRAYPCIINGPGAFSTMWNNWVGGGIGPGTGGGLILKPNQAGDILRFDLKWTKYSGDSTTPVAGTTMYTDGPFYIIKRQNGYGEPQIEDFYTVDVNKLMTFLSLISTSFTFFPVKSSRVLISEPSGTIIICVLSG